MRVRWAIAPPGHRMDAGKEWPPHAYAADPSSAKDRALPKEYPTRNSRSLVFPGTSFQFIQTKGKELNAARTLMTFGVRVQFYTLSQPSKMSSQSHRSVARKRTSVGRLGKYSPASTL